ncbi:MAG: 2-nonaprenyl-3-methyl-6-methoxy-1,4-benzoquinol hydroxylase [Alphaproteobacteria bacterium MarineAlpha2_Bin1]|nr:MAG: 2-nonaprenyl-3-methyl-6-methoxy-1,4-benzoquinol hydroxylase [Alphaproteobacteria bacterium MarineAlpha2_Bin1]|tara:strand:+ start:373 stop:948 length:576 start_codon:yes stop_codon:yes gene_type:complete
MNNKNSLKQKESGEHRLPGDLEPNEMIKRMIRVNQAGEYGAQRIYAGQLAFIKNISLKEKVKLMAEHEKEHLEIFNTLLLDRKIRPTALQPLWHVLGFALGASTALMGEKSAMACTVAVEEAIDEHYSKQADYLGDDEKELKEIILDTREDEIEHKEIAQESLDSFGTDLQPLRFAIKKGTKIAIWLSERF